MLQVTVTHDAEELQVIGWHVGWHVRRVAPRVKTLQVLFTRCVSKELPLAVLAGVLRGVLTLQQAQAPYAFTHQAHNAQAAPAAAGDPAIGVLRGVVVYLLWHHSTSRIQNTNPLVSVMRAKRFPKAVRKYTTSLPCWSVDAGPGSCVSTADGAVVVTQRVTCSRYLARR